MEKTASSVYVLALHERGLTKLKAEYR